MKPIRICPVPPGEDFFTVIFYLAVFALFLCLFSCGPMGVWPIASLGKHLCPSYRTADVELVYADNCTVVK